MRIFLLVAAFALIWTLLFGYLFSDWKAKEVQQLSKDTAVLHTTYVASVKMYQLATQTLFEEIIQRPEIIETFAAGLAGEDEAGNRARGRLYRLLASSYEHLRQKGIWQLHFHTADAHSFLRFHAPDKYGDPLAEIRPSVRLANRERRAVIGFEAGRHACGFRYVYPVTQNGIHLGTVETSVPFNSIRQAMSDLDSSREYAMILRRDEVEGVVFDEQLPLYEVSPIHDQFLVEDPQLRLPDSPPPPSGEIRQINALLQAEPQVIQGLATGQSFSLPISTASKDWAVSFVPIRDVLDRHSAYIVAYAPAPFTAVLRHDFFVNLILGTLTLAGFTWFTLRLVRSGATLEREKRNLLTITDTIGDGLYVMDLHGRITQVNPAFTKLLGYTRDEIVGRIGHDLFHIHGSEEESFPLAQCPIFAAARLGQSYSGEQLFRHKNGRCFTMEISCQPFQVQGEWSGAVVAFRDITQRKANEDHIRYLAQYDTLTSLPNRTLLQDRLLQAINRRPQNGEKFALLFLDLDHFKNINDSLGHEVGDLLLQEAAFRILTCVRTSDTVSRYGGDEFIVLLQQVKDPTLIGHVAEKILNTLTRPYHLAGHELHVTTSIGISVCPDDGQDAGTLIKNADAAMYLAKKNGRNNYQFFTADLNLRAFERLALESELRRALERGEFLLHYQPQVDLLGGNLIGAEALIRWMSPTRGLVSPGEFIPVAEECGLIVPIGEWVLREACGQWQAWQEAGAPPIPVAVNLSSLQFRQKHLEESIRQILAESGLAAQLLEIELTESALVRDTAQAVDTLRRLKSLGVRLSIDDFGTGYSSLSYLKAFPIDKLKIDQTFVRDVSHDPNDAAIASAIIAMAHSMHLKVIAEGVETPEQLLFLLQESCDGAQGYHYSRPLPAAAMEILLKNNLPLPKIGA